MMAHPVQATAHGPSWRDARHKTLMLVEDDHGTRAELAELLRDDGYEVLTASDGVVALGLLRCGAHVDGILLDLMMPVMDGWDFLRTLQGVPAQVAVPILVMTAATCRCQDFARPCCVVKKPLEVDCLLDAVEQLVDASVSHP
ncbi:MAG TPA: response regulator [Myxococcota bacterium]|nr:response regulator [Myxococcota bacterium]